jgi:hypothetical protein
MLEAIEISGQGGILGRSIVGKLEDGGIFNV